MSWDQPTALTVAYCKECHQKEGVKAFMDVRSEWARGDGSWDREIECRKCFRIVKSISSVSILIDLVYSEGFSTEDYEGEEE